MSEREVVIIEAISETKWEGFIFDGEKCHCFKCLKCLKKKKVHEAFMPREQTVTVTTVSEVTIKNGIFTSFDDAHTCCSLLADQEGFPKLTKGNAQRNKKTNAECPRLMCSKCKSQFMSFKRIINNAGNPEYRLFTCSSLEDYLKHSCSLTDHTPQRITTAATTSAPSGGLIVTSFPSECFGISNNNGRFTYPEATVPTNHKRPNPFVNSSEGEVQQFGLRLNNSISSFPDCSSLLLSEDDYLTDIDNANSYTSSIPSDAGEEVFNMLANEVDFWNREKAQKVINFIRSLMIDRGKSAYTHFFDGQFYSTRTGSSITTRNASTSRHNGADGSSNTSGSPPLSNSYPIGTSSSNTAGSSLNSMLTEKLKSKTKSELLDIRRCVQSIVIEGIQNGLIAASVSSDEITTEYLKSIGITSVSTQHQLTVAANEIVNLIADLDAYISIANALDTRTELMRNVRVLLDKIVVGGLSPATVAEQRLEAEASDLQQQVQELSDRLARMEIENKCCIVS